MKIVPSLIAGSMFLFITACDENENVSGSAATSTGRLSVSKSSSGISTSSSSKTLQPFTPGMNNDPEMLKKLQGKWKVVRLTTLDRSDEPPGLGYMIINNNQFTIKEERFGDLTGDFAIDTRAIPHKLDLRVVGDPIRKYIFQLQDNILILTYTGDPNIRPKKFIVQDGDSAVIDFKKVEE
ncbi:MAG: hypothetical protein R3B84_17660 [Zavarzinella sp.]